MSVTILEREMYTEAAAARLLRIAPSTLHWWLEGRAPRYRPVIRVEPTGKITAVLSTHSQGHGTPTTMAQVIAETLGVSYDDVTVYEDDSSRGGFSPGASGSRQGAASRHLTFDGSSRIS